MITVTDVNPVIGYETDPELGVNYGNLRWSMLNRIIFTGTEDTLKRLGFINMAAVERGHHFHGATVEVIVSDHITYSLHAKDQDEALALAEQLALRTGHECRIVVMARILAWFSTIGQLKYPIKRIEEFYDNLTPGEIERARLTQF